MTIEIPLQGMDQQEPKLTKRQQRASRREEKLQARARAAKKRKTKRILTWLVSVVVIVAVGYGVTQLGSHQNDSEGGVVVAGVDEVISTDHVKGNTEAAVTLIEYSDFQCPACSFYFPIVKNLVDEFGSDMRFIYRHYPLVQIHQFADLAARAAEAAGRQGKFWEMHDLLFENQQTWSNGNARNLISSYAGTLELDLEQFESDWDSSEVKNKVSRDRSSAIRTGLTGTPTFFLDGQKIASPRSYNEFAELIRIELGPEASGAFETLEDEVMGSDEDAGHDETNNIQEDTDKASTDNTIYIE